jgi:hypothetical protein
VEPWHWGLLIKPFVALVFILIARYVAVRVLARLPDGRVKRILSLRW